jgi:hypothetical protein
VHFSWPISLIPLRNYRNFRSDRTEIRAILSQKVTSSKFLISFFYLEKKDIKNLNLVISSERERKRVRTREHERERKKERKFVLVYISHRCDQDHRGDC